MAGTSRLCDFKTCALVRPCVALLILLPLHQVPIHKPTRPGKEPASLHQLIGIMDDDIPEPESPDIDLEMNGDEPELDPLELEVPDIDFKLNEVDLMPPDVEFPADVDLKNIKVAL